MPVCVVVALAASAFGLIHYRNTVDVTTAVASTPSPDFTGESDSMEDGGMDATVLPSEEEPIFGDHLDRSLGAEIDGRSVVDLLAGVRTPDGSLPVGGFHQSLDGIISDDTELKYTLVEDRYLIEFSSRGGRLLNVVFDTYEQDSIALDVVDDIALARLSENRLVLDMAQETTGKSREIVMQIQGEPGWYSAIGASQRLVVQVNGVGFEPQELHSMLQSLLLAAIRSRHH